MDIFNCHLSKKITVPIVANIPHSGTFIPDYIAAQFTEEHLQSLKYTDWHLDKLYQFLPFLGIPVLQATHSRYVVDLNREAKQPFLGRFQTSVVPEGTANGESIYKKLPSHQEIQERLSNFYFPYHVKLRTILQESLEKFGKVYLFDLHAFWGRGMESPIEICLGNRKNQSCSDFLIETVEQNFLNQGYQVRKNQLFPGGYITRHYSQLPKIETLQIEVRYRIYLEDDQLERLPLQFPDWEGAKFQAASLKFNEIFSSIVGDLSDRAYIH